MDIDLATIGTVVGAIAAALGGKEAWSYHKKKLDVKAKLQMHGNKGETELRNEIKDMLEGQISELKEQVRGLTERILLMEQEREDDKKRIANQEIKIVLLSERLTAKFSSTGKPYSKVTSNTENNIDDAPTIE